MTPSWLYAIACVVVPCLIGAATYAIFNLWSRWRRRSKRGAVVPQIDYLI